MKRNFNSFYIFSFLFLLFFSQSCSEHQSVENLKQKIALANEKGQWQEAVNLAEIWFQKDQSNYEANYEAATNYLRLNFPTKSLQILNQFKNTPNLSKKAVNWREARIAKAYYMTGQFEKVLEVVANYDSPKMYRGLAREHLKALIQLGDFETLSQQLDIYQQKGIFRKNEKTTNTDFLFRAVCNELFLIKNESELKSYALKFQQWIKEKEDKNSSRNLPLIAYYLKNYNVATSLLEKSILEEKSPRHLMELNMLLGVCFAKKENFAKAKNQIERIHAIDKLATRHDAFGAKFYQQARIETAMKKNADAIHSLKKALSHHAEFWSYKFKEDGFLKNLFEDASFKQLAQQKN